MRDGVVFEKRRVGDDRVDPVSQERLDHLLGACEGLDLQALFARDILGAGSVAHADELSRQVVQAVDLVVDRQRRHHAGHR